MKKAIWSALVKMGSLLPDQLIALNIRLMESVFVSRRNPRSGLASLLQEYRFLRHCIDEAAIRYEGGIHPKHRLMAYHDFFTSRVSAGTRVLDVGCGYGAVSHSLALAGAVVTGIDIDRRNVEHAKSRWSHHNLRFTHGDATQEIPAGPYETVVLSNVLEHIEDRVAFLRLLRAAVSPRRWLFRVPLLNRDWTVPMTKEVGLPHFSDATHFTEYTEESFVSELKDASLKIDHMTIRWGEIWAEASDA